MNGNAHIRTIVTGLGWMGSGTGSIDTAMEELVLSAKREIIILAYAMSDGAEGLLELLRERLRSAVRVTMVVDRMDAQHGNIPVRLRELVADYPALCTVYDFQGTGQEAHLHAKALIADRQRAIVGSANLSWHGLVTNHELALYIEGPAVEDIARVCDRLLTHRFVRLLAAQASSSTDLRIADTTSAPRTGE